MQGRRNARRRKNASVLGTTHSWIIADAFAKLRRADRYSLLTFVKENFNYHGVIVLLMSINLKTN